MSVIQIRKSMPQTTHRVRYGWEILLGLGMLLIVFGVIALAAPVVTSLTLSVLLGVVLVASGIAQLIHGVRVPKEPGKVSRFLLAVVSIVAGGLTLRNPVAGAMGVTMAIAFYLLASAAGKWFL